MHASFVARDLLGSSREDRVDARDRLHDGDAERESDLIYRSDGREPVQDVTYTVTCRPR